MIVLSAMQYSQGSMAKQNFQQGCLALSGSRVSSILYSSARYGSFHPLKATCTHPYISPARQQTPCSVSCSRVFQNRTHAPSFKRHCSVSPCLLLLHSTLV